MLIAGISLVLVLGSFKTFRGGGRGRIRRRVALLILIVAHGMKNMHPSSAALANFGPGDRAARKSAFTLSR